MSLSDHLQITPCSQGAGLLQAALENGFTFETDQNYWGFNKIWFFNWNWGEPNQIVINHSMGLPTSVEALHEALESQFGNSFLSGLFGKLNLSGPQVRFIIEHPNLFDGSTVTQMVDARDRGRYFVNSLGNGFVRTAKNKAQEYAAATVGQAVATAVAGIVQRLAKLKQAKKAIAEAAEAANNAKAPKADWVRPPRWQLPKNGKWSGTPGHSDFIPDNPSAIGLKPGDVIPFRQGKPDFSQWSKGNFKSKKPLTGDPVADRTTMIQTIAEEKGWTQQEVKDWLQAEQYSLHHAGGDDIQLIPWALHGNRSAIPPQPGVTHQGGAYGLRNQ